MAPTIDLIRGKMIPRGGRAVGPQIALKKFWQMLDPVIGEECPFRWRVQLLGDKDYDRFESLEVRVTVISEYTTITRTEPTSLTKDAGEIKINLAARTGISGVAEAEVGFVYRKPVEIKVAESSIRENDAIWTMHGNLDKRHELTLDGVSFILVDGAAPFDEPFELWFTASARFLAKKGFIKLGRPNSEHVNVAEISIASVSPKRVVEPLAGNGARRFPSTVQTDIPEQQLREQLAIIDEAIKNYLAYLRVASDSEKARIQSGYKSALARKTSLLHQLEEITSNVSLQSRQREKSQPPVHPEGLRARG